MNNAMPTAAAPMDRDLFTSRLARYMDQLEAAQRAMYRGAHDGEILIIVPARKYVHLAWLNTTTRGRSAVVSVEKATGDVFRSDGWMAVGQRIGSIAPSQAVRS